MSIRPVYMSIRQAYNGPISGLNSEIPILALPVLPNACRCNQLLCECNMSVNISDMLSMLQRV